MIVCLSRSLSGPAARSNREPPDQHVACFTVDDGRLLWDTLVRARPLEARRSCAADIGAPTPATDGERVYVLFGSAVLSAHDLTAATSSGGVSCPTRESFDVAIASSPILFHRAGPSADRQNGRKSALTAYELRPTACALGKEAAEATFNHSTPMMAEHERPSGLLFGGRP